MSPFIQRPAPTFEAEAVTEGNFTQINLQNYLGQWVILLFYPMDFTFVCPTEILAYNDAIPRLRELNTAVLGISTDSKYSHFAWATQSRKEGGLGPDLKMPLIADRNMKISREYGVLLEDEGISLRGLFIIDPKGILRQITINDLPVGRSVDETIRLIQAFQFTDENGEVCPANWTVGSKTIKADPLAKLEYFETTANGPVNANGVVSGTKRARVD